VTTSLDSVYAFAVDEVQQKPPSGTLMNCLLGFFRRTAEADNSMLRAEAKYALESLDSLHLLQSNVTDLLVASGKLSGVVTWEGVVRCAPRVALCVGSFLEARLRIGTNTEASGRLSEMAYDDLYLHLLEREFAFEQMQIEVPIVRGALPHSVVFQRFRQDEVGEDGFTLNRIQGLYSAGVCVDGELTYEVAALKGRALGLRLAAAVEEV
jgi:hypothetical protein